MIKAVLVDIDNTLLDFDAYVEETLKRGFEKFSLGEFTAERLATFHRVNHGVWRELEQGIITYDEILKTRFNRIFAAMGITFDGCVFEKFFKDSLFDNAIPVRGAAELLDFLSERFILCAASNGPFEQQLNRLKVAGMLEKFDHVFVSEAIGASKPSKDFFDHCMREINKERTQRGEKNIDPGEVMMIGDSLTSDMAGAIGAGMHTCFFDKQRRGEAAPGVEHTVKDLREIRTIL